MCEANGARKAILFVDDEPNILQGLRRMLRSMRHEWDMDFASGGQDALARLESTYYNVIVTDMRMPGMNGLELLNEVRALYPHMIRIVLSGQASKEVIVKSVGPIHQYLSKPCDPDFLKQILVRSCAIQDVMKDERLKTLVSRMESLPSLPPFYHQLMEELSSEDVSIKSVAKIVSRDIGMSAKILQLVNSAFFGISRHVSSPQQAVMLLGLEIVTALALTVKIFEHMDQDLLNRLKLGSVWDHSLRVGLLAKKIAREEHVDEITADQAFIAGMLHDIGKLVLAQNLPDEYTTVLKQSSAGNLSIHHAESDVFGVTHANVGAYLMGLWGFQDTIIEAILFHHNPSDCVHSTLNVLTMVHAANAIDTQCNAADSGNPVSGPDMTYLKNLGLDTKLEYWKSLYAETTESLHE